MKPQKKRVYKSETRENQALKTRKNILEAAKKLFRKEGFDRVTIQQLADAAGVSMPTIYALFKSKRGVLEALIDEALPTETFEKLVHASMAEKDPKKRLVYPAKMARQIYDAEKERIDLIKSAALVSPELKALEASQESRRHDRQEAFVKLFVKEKSLAGGLTPEKARDILWALTGRDLYRMLVMERGWSPEAYESWLAETLQKVLLMEK